jgi:tetratricopeptide (TPR) repeat protein
MKRTVLALCLAAALGNANVTAMVFAQTQEQSLQSLLADAAEAQSRRDFVSAAESYRNATEIAPAIPELWANLGLMYHESGKPAEAMQSFKQAIRLNPLLFVPQLFLGIEYLAAKSPEAAIPFLKKAEELNGQDLQAAMNLAKAYALMERSDQAAAAYSRAAQLAPNDGSVWLSLGMAYLQQVETDARQMVSEYKSSPFFKLRAAETFAEQGKLVQAEEAFVAEIASGSAAPCTHAEFGLTLLRRKELAKAREQFALEEKTGSHCGLARLGVAIAAVGEEPPESALPLLTSLAEADAGFVQSNLPQLRDAFSPAQAMALVNLSRTERNEGRESDETESLIEKSFAPDAGPPQTDLSGAARSSSVQAPLGTSAARLYARGQYAKCRDSLEPKLHAIGSNQLQLLASCSFYTGDFQTTSIAAERLKTDVETRAMGLYWESKADQKLAISALSRAGEIGADSPRMHVLLGDVFRQKRRWDDAEAEYRKAVALDAKSHAARLSLAIALFSGLKTDEAFDIDRSLLADDPNDTEANLLAGEILIQRNLYAEAEPYLSKCGNLKPEYVPRLHALLARVYAATDRIPAAISEYKAGLSTDEDGSIHYQLGRLYQKAGNKSAADEAFRDSQRLRRRWDDLARIALEQSSTDISHQ